MIPSSFPESNSSLGPPEGMTVEEVGQLSIARATDDSGNPVVVSCWKLTQEEFDEIIKTKRIYLGVIGFTMPPVWLVVKSPFVSG